MRDASRSEAMRLLADFEPRLVGPVLTGTATAHNDIKLHLFADTPETVAVRLLDRGIRARGRASAASGTQRDEVAGVPRRALRRADEHKVDATVFPVDGIRQAPLEPGGRQADAAGGRFGSGSAVEVTST